MERQGDTLLRGAQRWREAVASMWFHRELLGSHRVHFVRYEDLTINPRETLKGLCSFLGVEFQTTMLNLEHEVPVTGSDDAAYVSPQFDGTKNSRWRRELSQLDQRRIEEVTFSWMR